MSKVWLQLGRAGDIMCILPLLHKDAQDGKRWSLMVAAEYASVLEGVSYVDPIVFDGPHYEIAKAVEKAEEMGFEWHCSQVNGPKEVVAEYVYRASGQNIAVTTSFVKEMWKVSGRLKEWDSQYPLVFDRRDPEHENALLIDHGFKRGRQKRLILVSLEGNSSPFPHKDLLMELLTGRFKDDFRVMPLPKAERIYDLLVLYERAYCLVATDSAPLHLARAVPNLPVIALANDKPRLWNGSPWAPQHAFYCRYGDFIDRALDLLKAIENIENGASSQKQDIMSHHLWNGYNHKRRFDYSSGWMPLEVSLGACGRDSHYILQDKQRNPYLKDCIRMGLQKCKGEYLMLTRPDTEFTQPARELKHNAYYAYRINHTQDGQSFVPVVDMFCAKTEWWRAHLEEIPDYVFGPDFFWSHGLWALFTKYGAVDVTGSVYRIAGENKVMRESNPRIRHNRGLADTYINTNHIASRYPKVSEQVEVFASFNGLLKGGYNPAIIEHDDRILMAYRYHPFDLNLATKLALATVDLNDGRLLGTQPIELPDIGSMEDPRWFKFKNRLCMSWVESTVPKVPFKSVVKWADFEHETWGATVQPDFTGNDWSAIQKNWVFFDHNGTLHALLQCQPIHKIDHHETTGPKWAYGTIRGGTTPVDYNGQWLRFFHGGLDNEFGPHRRRYFVGALIMRKEPPFDVLRVSAKPIIYGSEVSDTKVANRPFHFKPNVVFPSGVIPRKDHWLLSVGVNDCESLIVKITEKQLNL